MPEIMTRIEAILDAMDHQAEEEDICYGGNWDASHIEKWNIRIRQLEHCKYQLDRLILDGMESFN